MAAVEKSYVVSPHTHILAFWLGCFPSPLIFALFKEERKGSVPHQLFVSSLSLYSVYTVFLILVFCSCLVTFVVHVEWRLNLYFWFSPLFGALWQFPHYSVVYKDKMVILNLMFGPFIFLSYVFVNIHHSCAKEWLLQIHRWWVSGWFS